MTGYSTSFPDPPLDAPNDREHRRAIAQVVKRINQGKINCVTTVTLNANATTTTLTDPRIGLNSFIGLSPLTSNAVAIDVAPRVTAQTNGSATITHGSSVAVDLQFRVAILG